MLLEDATSKEQVAAALEAGDEELLDDIEEKLKDAGRQWERRGNNGEQEEYDITEYIGTWDDFLTKVIELDDRLTTIPTENISNQLRWDAQHPVRQGGRRPPRYGPFYNNYDLGGFFGFEVPYSYYFDDQFLPTNYEFIPQEMVDDFWSGLGYRIQWQEKELGQNWGTGPGDTVYIDYEQDVFEEWVGDLIREYRSELASEDPDAAIERFLTEMSDRHGALVRRLREVNPSREDLFDLAQRWFEFDADNEREQDEIVSDVSEYLGAFSGSEEPREVLGEWDQTALRAMDITRGPLYEEAPWKLIKLHPSDLRLEGTLMRHCVGDAGMGYVKAVKDGEIEIWSLRSRKNKPRFTLEVDMSRFYHADDFRPRPMYPGKKASDVIRGRSIKQLKGKGNRTPGYAGARETVITMPDEVLFWAHALEELGIDPESVADFDAFAQPLRKNPGLCTGFDRPYQPLRRR